MKDCQKVIDEHVAFIKDVLLSSGAKGIVYGNSGGKDSVLVGILCKMACDNVLGVIMPAGTAVNYQDDKNHAILVAEQFGIEYTEVDLGSVKSGLVSAVGKAVPLGNAAISNIAPRLRMTTLYAIALEKSMIVAGTGNRSERYMGYFTKYGDGAYDFNPISDLTVTEIYRLLSYLKVPEIIVSKPPSGGLYEGQTDEKEMGVTYDDIDSYLFTGKAPQDAIEKIESAHRKSRHKRSAPVHFE